jgi:two-component system response regulator (stage 0 sporulation protein F)
MLFPDMEGLEVLKQIRGNSDLDQVHVITASATPAEELAPKVKDLKVAASLNKPIKTAELKKLLEEMEETSEPANNEIISFMLIDKNGVHQKVVEKLLTEIGCKTLAVDSLEAAEQLLTNVKVTGIILDLDADPAKVRDTLKRLAAALPEPIPIIVETSVVSEKSVQEFFRFGVSDILIKPINMIRLKESIQNTIEKKRSALEEQDAAGSKTLLIVEDFMITANMLSKLLSATNFKTIVARNGAQAYEIIMKKRPDLMILDLNLPGMNGLELLEHLEEKSIKIPFAVSTAERDEAILRVLRKMGALKIFKKPIAGDQLLTFIRSYDDDKGSDHSDLCSYQVLFAMADDSTSQFIEAAMHDASITCQVVTDGNEAIAEMKRGPSVLVVDTGIKNVSGHDIIKLARSSKQTAAVKILGLADKLDDALKAELTEIGANATIAKPFKIETLVSQLQELLSLVPPLVDIADFAVQFLDELEQLPSPNDAKFVEQAKRLGHNLAGTAGLISNKELHAAGVKLEDTAKTNDVAECQKQVDEIRKIIEQMAAKATLMKQ